MGMACTNLSSLDIATLFLSRSQGQLLPFPKTPVPVFLKVGRTAASWTPRGHLRATTGPRPVKPAELD